MRLAFFIVLYFSTIAPYFGGMITQKYNPTDMQNLALSILEKTGEKVLAQQRDILNTYHKRKTGDLAKMLEMKPFAVAKTAVGARLLINYAIHIRFLDLKFSKRGRLKDGYHPIYNRPLYGFVFGYAYGCLRWGLASNIKSNTFGPLGVAMKND